MRLYRRIPAASGLGALVAALLLPLPLGAQTQPDEHTVTVSATATVSGEPDRAVVVLAVENFAATAREAAAENARRTDAVIAALRRLRIPKENLQTAGYRLDPEYDYQRPPEPRAQGEDRLIGYRARNSVSVKLDDVRRVGEIIDAAIAAGANRVNALSFQLRDMEAARQEALRQAVEKATTEARTVAAALGRRLGPALAVSTGGAPVIQPRVAYARDLAVSAAAVAPPTPVLPGEVDVSAQVTIVFRLEP